MIAGLKRRAYRPIAVPIAVVALTAAAVLALLPGVAEAQEGQGATAPAAAPAHIGVVAPGDSLWSISRKRLGPSASPQQIARDVRRIHETNRNRIGDDPDLIFPGQRLALPPPAGASATEAPAARRSLPAAGGAPEQAARPPARRPSEPISLPALPEGGAVPEARSLPSPAVPGGGLGLSADDRRRLLGLGIIVLTFALAGLMAWRLPMRRDVGFDGAWGRSPGHNRYYYHYDPHYHYGEDRRDTEPPVEYDPHVGPFPITGPARRHEPRRNGAAGSPHKGLADAHAPLIRRALRRASLGATPPGRAPNGPAPGGARGPLRRAARGAAVRRRSARRRPAGLARGRAR